MSCNSWLQRYVMGECRGVWAEIQNFASMGRTAASDAEVRAVARETMRRVRWNVDLIIRRLQDSGYEFVDPSPNGCLPRQPLVPPNEDSPRFADWLGELVGPLPVTVSEWIASVGDVNLVGNHPEWPERDMLTDALVVEFELRGYADRGPGWEAKEHFRNELEEWKANVSEYGAESVGRFLLPFAPDIYHKANVSGGAPYGIYLPDGSPDATCHINGRDILFIDYLRECFSFAGLPGARSLPQIASLRRDLLPI